MSSRAWAWARRQLFSTPFDTVLTLVLLPVLGWVVFRLVRIVFVDGRWEIIERNLRLLLISDFPAEAVWRLWSTLLLIVATTGLAVGVFRKVRAEQVTQGRIRPPERGEAVRRLVPVLLLLVVLLWLAKSPMALLMTAVGAVAFVLARELGYRLLPTRFATASVAAALLAPFAGLLLISAFGGVPWTEWGGLMLTLTLTLLGITLAFPLGALLAFGRRSGMPVIRYFSVGYIELIRGVPLVTLLFMGYFVIGFLLPPGMGRLNEVARVLAAIVIFTSAYIAEIVRGGLQAVPRGQVEAAHALGLSAFATTRLIVLPQALRAVIPALVGQFISLFKDTSLVYVVGMTELLRVAESITKQPDFAFGGYIAETLMFAGFLYWVGSYTMSRESQRLERRLGVGER